MHSNHSDFDRKVEPQFEVKGSKAVLTLKAPHSGNTEVNIKLPARTDIYLRVSAGDITLGPIEGNKDLETHAGDIDIDIAQRSEERRVGKEWRSRGRPCLAK